MEEWEFLSWFGAFRPWSPARVARVLGDGFAWWVCGGWAADAFAGSAREHEDLDVGVFAADLPAVLDRLRAQALHPWANRGGTLTPLLPGAAVPDGTEQIWVRRDAYGPWRFELLVTAGDQASGWVNKRDGSVRPFDEATYLGPDGIRQLAPELVLLLKAALDRRKDRADLARLLPRLDDPRRRRFAADLATLHPGHPWLAQLEG